MNQKATRAPAKGSHNICAPKCIRMREKEREGETEKESNVSCGGLVLDIGRYIYAVSTQSAKHTKLLETIIGRQ